VLPAGCRWPSSVDFEGGGADVCDLPRKKRRCSSFVWDQVFDVLGVIF
jgi:hypothetical protein